MTRAAAILAQLDAENAPDIAYKSAFSTGARRPLAHGEAWRDRLVARIAYEKALQNAKPG